MSSQCFNVGCNKNYNEEENHDEACIYHSGAPYFHDAYKIWSCCNKKSIDFTEFLDIKGCKKSKHSNVKPEKPAANKVAEQKVDSFIQKGPEKIIERPSEDIELSKINYTISSSLETKLLEMKDKFVDKENKEEKLVVGTMCKNPGCNASYSSVESDLTACIHHTGSPIFHEGMKSWTCCQRRTSNFNEFLAQEGCNTGKHLWIKPKEETIETDKSKTCRFDWFQTATNIVINVYSKLPLPSLSSIESNPVKLNVSIVFGEDKKVFQNNFKLYGVIDVEKSQITYLPTKTEITLVKKSQTQWPKLEYINN